ncbi:DSD1 family PLP-dependent enzyme [Herminiimonas arsenitoxidans]|uniref:DSD1 family PLP-dependent enzyme n=1 Tax=Herminiimonas arsenitoxidans TaxID=1809410 RepID=UPI000971024F|nr:DSD1 family PLP-dependent enzyme [Herminiimonas arsenitoxidans]
MSHNDLSSTFTSNIQAAPAATGDLLDSVDTPALLVDLDAFEDNLARVHTRILQAGLQVRPHGKAHKSPAIAHKQIEAGAHGICCQKVSEAEVFVDAGIQDVLITNQIVGMRKVDRLAALAGRAHIGVCVDHPIQVEQLGDAVVKEGTHIDVLVEVDIGHGRCGVANAFEAIDLARTIQQYHPHLRFVGIHAFRGSAQHMRQPQERAAAVTSAVEKVRGIVQELEAAGFACTTITGGGTGTYMHEASSTLYTEVQPGSYVLMDTDYAANKLEEGSTPLQHALFGLCTVISVQAGHAVLDGGLKAFAVDQGLPRIQLAGWSVKTLSDEHTVIIPDDTATPLHVGDKVRLIPSHCDPTVNLHDWLIAFRGKTVEHAWPVSARGALF